MFLKKVFRIQFREVSISKTTTTSSAFQLILMCPSLQLHNYYKKWPKYFCEAFSLINLRHQMLTSKHLGFLLKHWRFDCTVFCIKRIHGMFNVHFVNFIEEIFYALIVPIIVDHNKTNLTGCYKGWYKPLIKFVNRFQIHLICFPFVFVHQIKGCMCNELIEMPVIFFLLGLNIKIQKIIVTLER